MRAPIPEAPNQNTIRIISEKIVIMMTVRASISALSKIVWKMIIGASMFKSICARGASLDNLRYSMLKIREVAGG